MKLNPIINILLPIALAVILPGLSLYSNGGGALKENIELIRSWFISSIFLYILWYLLWYWWEIKPKYKALAMVLGLAVFITLLYGAFYFFFVDQVGPLKWYFVIRIILASILLLAIQYALRAQGNISRLLLEKEQIQSENYRVQLKALQAKIDPHFLFNSLNTLRSMTRQKHSNSEKFIMSLSDFYRHTLKHNEDTVLQLSEELDVLESYLFVMKSRNEEAVLVDIDIDQSLLQFQLPTLALQVVVENCFKHNSMTSKMPLHIEIKNTDDYYIVIQNNIQPKIGEEDSSGYGLDLLRKRYELMKIKKGVIIEKSDEQFSVKLKLI